MASKYEIQQAAYRVTGGDYAYDGFTAEQWVKIGKYGIASALEELDRKGRKPSKRKKKNSAACQGSGWKMNPALAFRTKAAALKYAREHGLKGYSIRKNPEGAGRGGKATGAGAGGAGGGAGAGSQGGASRTEVRSPTRTSTATHAKTWGNITVTGGAGRGATTTVKIAGGGKKKKNPAGLLFKTRSAALKYAREHGAKRFSIKKLKRGR